MAERIKSIDRHRLYLASVQDPLSDVERISFFYREFNDREAISLREDFCGTFALACCWVQSQDNRSAIAFDHDQEALQYGKDNYFISLSQSEQSRLSPQLSDVRVKSDPVDAIVAFNFSYCLIHKRRKLLSYFQYCYQSLGKDGILVLDIFGGSESEGPEITERDINNNDQLSPFIFEFERKSFNPVNRRAEYGIHFKHPDGTQLIDAFEYDFRMWSIPEIRDVLAEAGFRSSRIFWEDSDEPNNYRVTEEEDNSVHWNAFIVGQK